MSAYNFNPSWDVGKIQFNHNENIPHSFRMLIVGESGAGKSNLLFKMLLTPDFLDFNNIMIFTKSDDQPEYQILYHGFLNGLSKEAIIGIFLNQNKFQGAPIPELCKEIAGKENNKNRITVKLSNKPNEIPHPQDLDKTKKNLIVFDDCVNEKNQSVMEAYYTRGRHSNCNCIYLSQSYYDLPKNSIRGNANFSIFFKLSKRDRDMIFSDLLSADMSKQEFVIKVQNIWKDKFKYVAIDRTKGKIFDNLFS